MTSQNTFLLSTSWLAVFLCGTPSVAQAGLVTYLGGGTTSSIEDLTNYDPQTAPANSTTVDSLVIAASSTVQPTLTIARSLLGLDLADTAGGKTLTAASGGPLTLSLGTGGITSRNTSGTNTIGSTTAANNVNVAFSTATTSGTTNFLLADVAAGGTLRLQGSLNGVNTAFDTTTARNVTYNYAKNGPGTLELTGSGSLTSRVTNVVTNTISGTLSLNAGTIRVVSGAGGLSGGTGGGGQTNLTIALGATYEVAGGTAISAGALSGAGTLTGTGGTTRTFTAGQQTATTFSGLISGNLNFAQSAGSNTSTLTLSNALNSYTGTTSITANSTLLVAGNAPNGGAGVTGVLGNSTTAVNLGPTANQVGNLLVSGGNFTLGRDVTANIGNTNTLALGGNGNFNIGITGNISIGRTDSTRFFDLRSASTGANAVTFSGNIITGTAAPTSTAGLRIPATVTNYTSNSTTTTTSNQGNIVLSGTNTYTGITTISGGLVTAASDQPFGSLTATTAGVNLNPATGTGAGAATVNFTSADPAVASLASAGSGVATVVLGNGTAGTATTLTVGGNNASTTFSGAISEVGGAASGALRKSGTGTFTLAGLHSYTGGTTVAGGSLVITNPGTTLGTGNVSVLDTAITLTLGTGTAVADHAVLSLAGGSTIGLADSGYLTLTTNETVGGLVLGNIAFAPGTYGSSSSTAENVFDEYFSGAGVLTVLVPEPGSASLLAAAGLLLGGTRRRRKLL